MKTLGEMKMGVALARASLGQYPEKQAELDAQVEQIKGVMAFDLGTTVAELSDGTQLTARASQLHEQMHTLLVKWAAKTF